MTEQEKEIAEELAHVIFGLLTAESEKPISCGHENGLDVERARAIMKKGKNEFVPIPPTSENAQEIKNPKHYQIIDDFESIDIIACSMTVEQFKGFCLGNIIKYRLRAGNKDSLEQDIAKANEYKLIFNNKKHLCRG